MELADVAQLASNTGLSPLVTRIALLVAEIDGRERALQFIESCREEDEMRALLSKGIVTMADVSRSRGQSTPGSNVCDTACR